MPLQNNSQTRVNTQTQTDQSGAAAQAEVQGTSTGWTPGQSLNDVFDFEDTTTEAPSLADTVEAPSTVANTTFRQAAPVATQAAPATSQATTTAPTAQTKTAEPLLSSKPSFRQAAAASGVASPVEAPRAETGTEANEAAVPEFTYTQRKQQTPVAASEKPAEAQEAKPSTQRSDGNISAAEGPSEVVVPETKRPLSGAFSKYRSRGKKARWVAEDTVKRQAMNKQVTAAGNNVSTKLTASPNTSVGFQEISIGSNVVLEALRQPECILIDRVNAKIRKRNEKPGGYAEYMREFSKEEFMGEGAMDSLYEFINTVNKLDVWVTFTKSPTTDPQSFQARILRIHEGDGIRLHPLAVKAFNADFDGDDGTIHFGGEYVSQARNPVAYLIGIDGSPMIDWDYFPKISINTRKTANIFKRWLGDLKVDTDAIASAWNKMVDGGSDVEFLRSLAETCGYSARKTAEVLDALYHSMLDANKIVVNKKTDQAAIDELAFANMTDLTAAERAEWRYVAEAKAGRMPANWSQYMQDTASFMEDVPGKNPQFRQGANVAKAIKRNPDIFIGPDGTHKSLRDSALGLEAQAMAGKTFTEGQQRKNEQLSSFVIERVGYPKDHQDFNTFLRKFATAYNMFGSVMDAAEVEFDTGLSVISEGKGREITGQKYSDFVDAFIEVYGDKTVFSVFGPLATVKFSNQWQLAKKIGTQEYRESGNLDYDVAASGKNLMLSQSHKYKTIREFAFNNKALYSTTEEKNPRNKTITSGNANDFILAIADSRTSSAYRYEQTAQQAFEAMVEACNRFKTVTSQMNEGNFVNLERMANKHVAALAGTHPDMFAYFGMDDIAGFMDSDYGRMMLSGTYPMGSIRLAMVYEWRMSRAETIRSKIRESESSEEYTLLTSQLDAELKVLASSSDVWSMLVGMSDEDFRAYCHRIRNGGTTIKRMTPSGKAIEARAQADWIKNWQSVDEFMLDADQALEAKKAIIADLVIEHGGWIRFRPTEVMYGMELDPASNYSGVNIAGFQEKQGMTLKTAMDDLAIYEKAESGSKAWFAKRDDETNDLYRECLQQVREDPGCVFAMSPTIWADAVVAQADKAYADSEKASQQDAVEKMFIMASNYANGTIVQEIATVDNFAMGLMGIDQVTKLDVAKVLADPEFSITVYDAYGKDVRINREVLGIKDDADLRLFLDEYPQLSAALIPATPSVDGKNVSYSMGTSESHTFLMDHPGFGALCSLFTPHANRSSMNMASEIVVRARELAAWMQGLDLNERIRIAPELGDELSNEVTNLVYKYAAELQERNGKWQHTPITLTWDEASKQSFYDVRQTLNAAKTSSSTGVEGYMTTQHGVIQLYLPNVKDSYLKVDAETDPSIQESLVGQPTSEGVPYEPGMECIVYAPDMEYEDETLDIHKNQMTSASRWFMVKRMKSGEDHNTKVKKSGDDGTDSISKRNKYDLGLSESWEQFESRAQNAWWDMIEAGAEPMFAIEKIRYMFAERLKEADEKLDYDDMEDFHYMNLARLMVDIADQEDEQGPYQAPIFRSLEQISAALRANIGDKVADLSEIKSDEDAAGIRDWFIQECEAIIADVGKQSEADPISILLSAPVFLAKEPSGQTAKRKRSSSYSRNMDLMLKKIREDGEVPLTYKQIQGISKNLVSQGNYAIGNGYYLLGVLDGTNSKVHTMPGNNHCVLLASTANEYDVVAASWYGQDNGMTVLFENFDVLEQFLDKFPEYGGYVIPHIGNTGYYGIPFFDIEQNGFGHTQSAVFQGSPDAITLVCEDGHNRHDYGDATAFGTQALFDKINNVHASNLNGSRRATDPIGAMFANTIEAFDGCKLSYSVATAEDLAEIKAGNVVIDYRIQHENNKFDVIQKKYQRLMDEFFAKWDGESQWLPDSEPDRCIGFMKCDITDPFNPRGHYTVFAPIIPFQEHKAAKRKAPSEYLVGDVRFNPESGNVEVDWINCASLEGRYLKFHEGYCSANKEVMVGEPVADHKLPDGTKIDVFLSKNTTSGRRLGSNRRRDTMITLLAMTYKEDRWRFNVGELPGGFPENPGFAERLIKGRIQASEWRGITKFHEDPAINDFMERAVKRAFSIGVNPSDFFANKFMREDGTWGRANNFYEFELMLQMDFGYQEGMLRMFHALSEKYCPNGLDDPNNGNHLFRVNTDDGPDYGCLQMQVPYHQTIGEPGYTWENVYASWGFFGENTSLTEHAGLSAADIEFQSLQMTLHGGLGSDMDFVKALRYATAGTAPNSVRNTSQRKVEIFQLGAEVVEESSDIDWKKEEAVCFTGHRPPDLYGYNKDQWRPLYKQLYAAIEDAYNRGKRVFIHGGAQGVDQIAAMAVREFQKKHDDVRSIMAVPYENQSEPWRKRGDEGFFGHNMWMELRNSAEEYILFDNPTGKTEKEKKKDAARKLTDRNTWMLDNSSELIAAWNGKENGGTYDTVNKARGRGYNVTNVLSFQSKSATEESAEINPREVVNLVYEAAREFGAKNSTNIFENANTHYALTMYGDIIQTDPEALYSEDIGFPTWVIELIDEWVPNKPKWFTDIAKGL